MQESDITRINELYHKQKAGTMTPKEKAEQAELRARYIADIRKSLRGTLETVTIKESDGSLVDVKKRHDEKFGDGEE